MRKYIGILLAFILFNSCDNKKQVGLSEGVWLAELSAMDGEIIPFNFKLKKDAAKKYQIELYNAEEAIVVDEIEVNNDSITIHFPVYEGYIAATFTGNLIEGEFIKESLNRIVPFKATYGITERFKNANPANHNISGIWETEFEPNTEDAYKAKGIFKQEGNKVTGTFRTEIGDYRYMQGVVSGDTLKVSAFDGAHAFVFTAKVADSSMNGAFYSGNHSKDLFNAKRNEAFTLTHTDSLTYLKEGYDKFVFSFPNGEGEMVSLEDARFQNKVVIVQIMGTWCPNCLDETKYYVDYLKKNPNTDVEIVALSFEYAKTEKAAFKAINRLKERIGVGYPILLAQYGSSDKDLAQQKLPMLNHVLSYPTSIYIDKKGKVRKIHTGFNGPATGEKFTEFKTEFESFIGELLTE